MNREMLMLVDAIARGKSVRRDVVLPPSRQLFGAGDEKALSGRRGYSRFGRSRQRCLRRPSSLAGGSQREAGIGNPDAQELLMEPSVWPKGRRVTTLRSRSNLSL